MPVNMLPVTESTWPAELTPPGQFGARRHGELRKQALDRYAERMRLKLTPSTKVPPPAELTPFVPRVSGPYVPRGSSDPDDGTMTRQCFVCGRWKWCAHREPELVNLWRRKSA